MTEIPVEIRRLDAAGIAQHLDALAEVLSDCVAGGASVSFMPPFSPADAAGFFLQVAREVDDATRVLLAAFEKGDLVGTVQVVPASAPNQPHRADVAKLLVHRRARGHGIAALLMQEAERVAKAEGRTLLVLDTATGGTAERLYERLGWHKTGVIPRYALYPDGTP